MSEIIATHPADDEWGVTTVVNADRRFRRKPCADCPWAVDSPIGAFPPEAFIHSARTAYDLATHRFGCHTSGTAVASDCAGFLLRGAAHNISVRMFGPAINEVSDGGRELYRSYREMAEANGVDPHDPALRPCRDDGGVWVSAGAVGASLAFALCLLFVAFLLLITAHGPI